jgi:hypothetical protein
VTTRKPAPSTDPAYEPFVLALEWFCVSCGWRIVMDAPGFAGDGIYHYPAPDGSPGGGSSPCGPLLARRARGGAR